MTVRKTDKISDAMQRIIDARHHDPFEVLGRHIRGDICQICVFLPDAEKLMLAESQGRRGLCTLATAGRADSV
ncbi:MAG: hypothetical protein ABW095_11355, partial [Candidatus Thiodiazotropha sp.]